MLILAIAFPNAEFNTSIKKSHWSRATHYLLLRDSYFFTSDDKKNYQHGRFEKMFASLKTVTVSNYN